jgi:integrase
MAKKSVKVVNQQSEAKAATINGNHPCGGFYLTVRGGSARWTFRHKVGGKQHEVTIGLRSAMSRAEARIKADELRKGLKQDKIDPRTAITTGKPTRSARTFRDDTLTYHGYAKGKWDGYHATLWLQSMERHVLPKIGKRDSASLTVMDIVGVIEPLWIKANPTAINLHGRIRAVLEHAIGCDDHKRFPFGNPADRALKRLPRLPETAQTPHPTIDWEQAPKLYARLCGLPGKPAMALRFLLLTCTPRAAEIIGARWEEIDIGDRFTGDVWHVVADRMKSDKPRDIPLTPAALELLASIRPADAAPDDFIFPGRKGKTVAGVFVPFSGTIHKDAMQILLREELQLDCHVHGLRATFRSWVSVHAQTVRDHDAAEIALDHVIGGKVQRAYDRADMMVERRALADRWAAFLIG